MRLFAAALLIRKIEGDFDAVEIIPVVVAADSEKEAGKEAKREARKTYPKDQGWRIVGSVVEIDPAKFLEVVIKSEDEMTLNLPIKMSERIH